MGGYGASRIGMKHPDVFGSLYIMSPCCMSARPAGPANSTPGEAVANREDTRGDAALPFGRAHSTGFRRRLVAGSKEPAAIPRSADEGRRVQQDVLASGQRMLPSHLSINTLETCDSIVRLRSM